MPPPAAIDFGTLCDELQALGAAPPPRDAATRAERDQTLTDGYARALSLEAERLKLERRIGTIAAEMSSWNKDLKGLKADELADLSIRLTRACGDLAHLRKLLLAARQRASTAA
jgi:hypothetical protein